MKKQVKKLILSKETVRNLEERTLSVVAGGTYQDTSCIWRLCNDSGETCFC